jgi:hydroxymethylpyrimidine/phosphomethylpyrimidine kinase
MLGTAAVVREVARELRDEDRRPFVCDPVLAASSGEDLFEREGVEALQNELFPLVTLLTPNADEARALTGIEVRTVEDAIRAGEALRKRGPESVLVKGGHLSGSPGTDVLVTEGGPRLFPGGWIDTPHTHGTGCVLSAAIAAHLALGSSPAEAIAAAKRFTADAIRRGGRVGAGPGSVVPAPGSRS